MTLAVVTVGPDDPLERADRLVVERDVSGLPVVEDGRVVGRLRPRHGGEPLRR